MARIYSSVNGCRYILSNSHNSARAIEMASEAHALDSWRLDNVQTTRKRNGKKEKKESYSSKYGMPIVCDVARRPGSKPTIRYFGRSSDKWHYQSLSKYRNAKKRQTKRDLRESVKNSDYDDYDDYYSADFAEDVEDIEEIGDMYETASEVEDPYDSISSSDDSKSDMEDGWEREYDHSRGEWIIVSRDVDRARIHIADLDFWRALRIVITNEEPDSTNDSYVFITFRRTLWIDEEDAQESSSSANSDDLFDE
jgi:hypothetical protein